MASGSNTDPSGFVHSGAEIDADAEVLDDLTGEAAIEDDANDSLDGEGDEGAQAGPADDAMLEDDSMHSFEGHTDAVLAVAWSPAHPDLVATGGQDDKAFLWRVGQDAYESTAGSLSTFELLGHNDTIASLGFNTTGTMLATGGLDGVAKVWNTQTGELIQTLEGPGGGIEWVKWHPKGNVLLGGSEDYTMWMWLAQTGACMQVFTGHSGPVVAGDFTADGKLVVSVGGEEDHTLRTWNPKTGECLWQDHNSAPEAAAYTCMAVHHKDPLVLAGLEDGSVRMFNAATKRVLSTLTLHEDSVEAVGFSRHLALAASAGVDGALVIWEVDTQSQRSKCEHPDVVTRMAWHPTQPLVFTACLDGIIRCWDLRTGTMVRQSTGHQAAVQDLALSPDGSMLLSGSDDFTARVFMTS